MPLQSRVLQGGSDTGPARGLIAMATLSRRMSLCQILAVGAWLMLGITESIRGNKLQGCGNRG